MSRYLVMTRRTPVFDPALLGVHYAFLDGLRNDRLLEPAGPFGDHSGGAYLLGAKSLNEATAIALRDPLHRSGSSLVTGRECQAK